MSEATETVPQSEQRKGWHLKGESWVTGSSVKKARLGVYVEWLLMPPAEREPKTKRELAEQFGVTAQTLRNYAKDPWLQRELLSRQRTVFRVERIGPVLESLYHQAIDADKPSVQAAKTLLDWVNKTVEPSLGGDLTDMSDDDLRALARSVLDIEDLPLG